MLRIEVSHDFVKNVVPARQVTSKKERTGQVGRRRKQNLPRCTNPCIAICIEIGTDLVYTAVPRSNIVTVRSYSPNIIALPSY